MYLKEDQDNLKVNALIDWVSGTFRLVFTPNDFSLLIRSLGYEPFEYTPLDHALNGYQKGYLYGSRVKFFTDEEPRNHGEWRTQILLSGDACRDVENNNSDSYNPWLKVFDLLYKMGFKATRIDTPIDDYSGSIKAMELYQKIIKREYATNFRKWNITVNDVEILDKVKEKLIISKNDGFTFYIGGRETKQLCIYNKAAEREKKNYLVNVADWVRFEARWYDEVAETMFVKLHLALESETINRVIAASLGGLVAFKQNLKYDISNRNKEENWSKWDKLLKNVSKESIKVQYEVEKTLVVQKDWFIKAASMILARLIINDPSKASLIETISCERLLDKFTYKDLAIINEMNRHEGKPHVTLDEAKESLKRFIESPGYNRLTGELVKKENIKDELL
jgi:hypothetical protein